MLIKFNREENTIFLDVDGVVADFDAFIYENLGSSFKNESDETDAEMWNFIKSVPHFYSQLPRMDGAHELVNFARSLAQKVEFLTAIPRKVEIPTAESDKRVWLACHFGSDIPVRIGPYSRDKWLHCSPGDILVDDRADNIHEWIHNGNGFGVLHKSTSMTKTILKSVVAVH